ncbi:MAG: Ankyrin repeats (3 copies) [Chlorobi bacterium OLB7]|nr:MAG: Ankyrin repeats (3 copies) [Chlorobi bacterium OLB7]
MVVEEQGRRIGQAATPRWDRRLRKISWAIAFNPQKSEFTKGGQPSTRPTNTISEKMSMPNRRPTMLNRAFMVCAMILCAGLTAAGQQSLPQSLQQAAAAGDLAAVQQMVAANPTLVNQADGNGRTPLHAAATEGKIDVVTFLLSNKAAVDPRDNFGATPLYLAVQNDHELVIRHLLARDANPSAATNDGLTPLHWAALRGTLTNAELLLQHGASVNARSKVQQITPLHETWSGNRADMAKLLVRYGADVNAVEKWYGFTPLHFAGFSMRMELTEELLALGADPTIKAANGFTVDLQQIKAFRAAVLQRAK